MKRRGGPRRSRPAATLVHLESDELATTIGSEGEKLHEEIELIKIAGSEDRCGSERRVSPCALDLHCPTSVLRLPRALFLAPPPSPRETRDGIIGVSTHPFSGFVFKVQANMDPRHRDRVAFVRVRSGEFEAGAEAIVSRTGQKLRLAQPQEFMARERTHADSLAVAGDVVGILDRGQLRNKRTRSP